MFVLFTLLLPAFLPLLITYSREPPPCTCSSWQSPSNPIAFVFVHSITILMHWGGGANPTETRYASEICTETQNQIWFIYLEIPLPPLTDFYKLPRLGWVSTQRSRQSIHMYNIKKKYLFLKKKERIKKGKERKKGWVRLTEKDILWERYNWEISLWELCRQWS